MSRLQKVVALVLGIAVALLAPALVWALVIAGLIQVTGSGVIVAILGPVPACALVIAVLMKCAQLLQEIIRSNSWRTEIWVPVGPGLLQEKSAVPGQPGRRGRRMRC